MLQPSLSTNSVTLHQYTTQSAQPLYDLCKSPKAQALWSPEWSCASLNGFQEKLESRLRHRWCHYRLFTKQPNQQCFGFAYCYNSSVQSGTAFLSLFTNPATSSHQLNMHAGYLYLSYLFYCANIRKIYAEVLEYNPSCLKLCQRIGFQQEGKLSDYQYWNDRYWDQFILSLNREQFASVCKQQQRVLQKLSCLIQTN